MTRHPLLEESLGKIGACINAIKDIESTYFSLEASEKMLYSQLFLKADGKNIAEREANVYASQEWNEFMKGLCEVKTKYNFLKRNLELAFKGYESNYLSLKLDAGLIRYD